MAGYETSRQPRPYNSAMIRRRPVRAVARIARYLLLALAVHVAQQGALVHAVSHLHESIRIGAPGTATVISNSGALVADEFCLECLAFAQVASAVPGHTFLAPDSQLPSGAIAFSGRLAEPSATVVFLARAPPQLI
jgi:hypothetical protein